METLIPAQSVGASERFPVDQKQNHAQSGSTQTDGGADGWRHKAATRCRGRRRARLVAASPTRSASMLNHQSATLEAGLLSENADVHTIGQPIGKGATMIPRSIPILIPSFSLCVFLLLPAELRAEEMETVKVASDNQGFVLSPSGQRYVPWGHNYASVDLLTRLTEDQTRVEREFAEMKAAGTTVARIHPEMPQILAAPDRANPQAIAQLRRLLKIAEDTGTPQNVVLNLEDVPFIDSSGIGAIVFLFKRLKVQQRNMRITGVTGQPAELFRMLRVHKAIPTDMRDENARGAVA